MNKKYRKTIIAGNWKMNLLPSQIKPFIEELRSSMPKSKNCDTVLCVPLTHVSTLRRALKDSRIAVGTQDASAYESGAYTGEVAAEMLSDLNCKYVVVGHSERRAFHHETDFDVAKKAFNVIKSGMLPIICVGESLEQREAGVTMEYIAYQVRAALSFIPSDKIKHCVIAYEPIWAIGTGKTATPQQAQEVCNYIRKIIRETHGARIARGTSVLYGGSMNAANALELLLMPDVDGGLIGGASLKPSELAKIIRAVDIAAPGDAK
jgi:triosephosphate isomerase